MSVRKDLGMVTAYAYALSKGYAGTEEQFATLMASYADVGQAAVDAALAAKASEDAAKASETAAEASETAAATSAGTATTAAQTASQAAQIATTKASEATTAASTATTKAAEAAQSATAAAGSATSAGTAATNAQTAQTAAEAAQTAAEAAQAAAEQAAQTLVIDPTLTQPNQAAEAKATGDAISLLKSHLNAISVEDTASGAIATFPDGSDGIPVEGLTVTMEPIQDLHGQANPYPPGGGKNLFQTTATTSEASGVKWTVNADGSITVSGTATAYTGIDAGVAKVSASLGNVTISGISGATNIAWGNVVLQDSGNSTIATLYNGGSTATMTFDLSSYSNADNILVKLKRNSDGAVSGTVKIQIEIGSSATTWVPYSNICPISGRQSVTVTRAGVNVWDEELETGGIDDTTGEKISTAQQRSKNYISVKPNTSYYACAPNLGTGGLYVYCYDADKNFLGRVTVSGSYNLKGRAFTTLDGTGFILFKAQASGGNYDEISINYPATDTAYHPGTVASVEVQLGETVYGGTVDVTTGEMVVDRAIVDLGTLTWSASSSNPGVFSSTQLSGHALTTGINVICSHYPAVDAGNYSLATMPDKTVKTNATYADYIYIKDSVYTGTSAADFKTAMSGVQVCYYLATPLIVQLVGQSLNTLKGVNNIWSDGGNVSVDYVADTKLYIQKAISAAVAALS